jgi:hypothetical protein
VALRQLLKHGEIIRLFNDDEIKPISRVNIPEYSLADKKNKRKRKKSN